MMYKLILILSLSYIALVNGNSHCIESDVSMQFRSQRIQNNSYVIYSQIERSEVNRVYYYCNSANRCSLGEWYLLNGERILGGRENANARDKFARSHVQRIRNLGLYCLFSPPQRGRFWCELPDSNGTNCTLFVNIVNNKPEIIGQPFSQAV